MTRFKIFQIGLLCIALLGLSQTVQAQTTILLPTSTLNFAPSTDHSAVDLAGNPLVSNYKVVYCLSAAPTNCLPSVNVGKPAPIAGDIAIANVVSSIQPNTAYTAKVYAVGPGGESASNATSPFGNAVLTAPAPPTNVRIVR